MVNRGATTEPYCALFAPPLTLPFNEGETDNRVVRYHDVMVSCADGLTAQ